MYTKEHDSKTSISNVNGGYPSIGKLNDFCFFLLFPYAKTSKISTMSVLKRILLFSFKVMQDREKKYSTRNCHEIPFHE